MALLKTEDKISPEEYLQGELKSDIRHEYVDGRVYAMTGASVNHNRITGNLARLFGNHLNGKDCETFTSDMKLKVNNEYRYPDIMVVCDNNFLDNGYSTQSPVLIVEVLSKSTRKTDTTEKVFSYLNIPTLLEYVLIEQDIVSVEVMSKSQNWQSRRYYLGDQITFESISLSLSVEEIYERVENEDMQEYLYSE